MHCQKQSIKRLIIAIIIKNEIFVIKRSRPYDIISFFSSVSSFEYREMYLIIIFKIFSINMSYKGRKQNFKFLCFSALKVCIMLILYI